MSVRDLYAELGVELRGPDEGNASVRCFASPEAHRNGDRSASCSVSLESGAWNCKACGAHGGAYDACLAIGMDKARAMEALREHGLVSDESSRPAPSPKPRAIIAAVPAMDPRVAARLREIRGWAPEVIAERGLGFDGERIVFPIKNAKAALVGHIRYLPNPETRNGHKKVLADRGTPRELWPPPELVVGGPLWFFEGESDAVSGATLGLPSIGLPGARSWRREWATRFSGRSVVVCMDCDADGRDAAATVAADLAAAGVDVRVLDLNGTRTDGYDIGDLLRETPAGDHAQLRGLLEQSAAGLQPVGAEISDGIRATPYAQIERRAIDWLWDGRIPRGLVTLLVGDPGLGKSLLSCKLAAQVTRGRIGDTPGGVFLITAEDDPSATIRPRLEACGADLALVRNIEQMREGVPEGLSFPDDIAKLREAVLARRPALIVVDPLMAHLGESVSSMKDQSVRRALAPFHRLAQETDCAVLIVAHLNKSNGADPIYRIGGSVGIPGAARSVLLMARDPDDPEGEDGTGRLLAHPKCNVGAKQPTLMYRVRAIDLAGETTPVLEEMGESKLTSRDLLKSALGDDDRQPVDEAAEFLIEELCLGPQPVKELQAEARAAGIAPRTLERAKHSLKVESKRAGGIGEKGQWQWSLPADHPANLRGGLSADDAGVAALAETAQESAFSCLDDVGLALRPPFQMSGGLSEPEKSS